MSFMIPDKKLLGRARRKRDVFQQQDDTKKSRAHFRGARQEVNGHFRADSGKRVAIAERGAAQPLRGTVGMRQKFSNGLGKRHEACFQGLKRAAFSLGRAGTPCPPRRSRTSASSVEPRERPTTFSRRQLRRLIAPRALARQANRRHQVRRKTGVAKFRLCAFCRPLGLCV